MPRRFTQTLVDYIDGQIEYENLGTILGGKLVLGGGSGVNGGSGLPWRGVIGKLVQTKVTYDTSEAAVQTTSSDPSLLDNLNHIRYDLENIDGDNIKTTSDDALVGAVPVTFSIAVPSGAATNKDITVKNTIRVIDVWAEPYGAGHPSDTVQLKNNTNAITNAMDWSGDKDGVVRADHLYHDYTTISGGGTLRVTTVDNDSGDDVTGGHLYVLAVRED